jgi:hypothetical protein
VHREEKAYRSQEIQCGHHVEATDFQHVRLHEKIHMQANFQTCSNAAIVYIKIYYQVKRGRHGDVNWK